jgi:hypothetical protein
MFSISLASGNPCSWLFKLCKAYADLVHYFLYIWYVNNNQHEYGPMQDSMQLIKICKKGWHMNITENLYIQCYHRQQLLIGEQYVADKNPLFQLINLTPPTPAITQPSEPDTPS